MLKASAAAQKIPAEEIWTAAAALTAMPSCLRRIFYCHITIRRGEFFGRCRALDKKTIWRLCW
jgi:hypothetical protein